MAKIQDGHPIKYSHYSDDFDRHKLLDTLTLTRFEEYIYGTYTLL